MTNPTIKIHNVEIDEVIEREMNAEEFARYEANEAAEAARQAEAAQIAADKAALLSKLGITEDEAKLLLS
jgi:hypothetical protein